MKLKNRYRMLAVLSFSACFFALQAPVASAATLAGRMAGPGQAQGNNMPAWQARNNVASGSGGTAVQPSQNSTETGNPPSPDSGKFTSRSKALL
ncbi:hypothetical protein [Paraburkholderia dinghuensis]|uniref:Lipoprotein n=1 Tax=Paraburkholderia dinghuensis TaxID=2305225 RepID=A0A3N6MHJ9_9BURK|nr:hypothetical protein [Paraburkholderia dinghuensis]RQH00575.1 hypothetical protein D1Y85_25150 [Paraburkholderia dinghuensis]